MLGPEEARLLLALAMLGTASAMDLRSRSVSDWLWIAFGAGACVLYFIDMPGQERLPAIALSLALAGGISFAVYRIGLFGGADALGFFVLALIVPEYSGRYLVTGAQPGIFPLAVLVNALLLSCTQVAANVARNLLFMRRAPLFEGFEQEPAARKAVAFMIGYRAKNPRFCFAIEGGTQDGKKFNFAPARAETAEYGTGRDVWVTPGTPFLAYMLAGYVVTVFAGSFM
ncbi:prepilin peptidase [Candidatus Nitrososphaera sp. FF02]|uniref:A24 family peptidase n=1 Tax=Candidatus Nitrososphaera sp. FF02 TaxID=3398226 RepID=UPI0039ED9245